MREQGNEFIAFEVEDDVEGHVQPPRGDDTDYLHSIVLQ